MKIILDQNIHKDIKEWIKQKKPDWEVYHIADLEFNDESGGGMLFAAIEDRPVLITLEEDFTDIKILNQLHNGIIRIDIWLATGEETREALTRLFDEVEEERLKGAAIVIDKKEIRIGKL